MGGRAVSASTTAPTPTNVITILSPQSAVRDELQLQHVARKPRDDVQQSESVAALGTASPTPDILSIGPYFPSGTMNQWSFDVERALWRDAGLDVQYLGNHTYHLDTSWQRMLHCLGQVPFSRAVPISVSATSERSRIRSIPITKA